MFNQLFSWTFPHFSTAVPPSFFQPPADTVDVLVQHPAVPLLTGRLQHPFPHQLAAPAKGFVYIFVWCRGVQCAFPLSVFKQQKSLSRCRLARVAAEYEAAPHRPERILCSPLRSAGLCPTQRPQLWRPGWMKNPSSHCNKVNKLHLTHLLDPPWGVFLGCVRKALSAKFLCGWVSLCDVLRPHRWPPRRGRSWPNVAEVFVYFSPAGN